MTSQGMDASDDEWLEELCFSHHQSQGAGSSAPAIDHDHESDYKWLEELCFSHCQAQGAGSSALGPLAGSSTPCHANVADACSSASHVFPTVSASRVGSSTSGGPVYHHAPIIASSTTRAACSKAEAKKAFIVETKSMGTLPYVSIPGIETVMWTLDINDLVDPVAWGKQRLAAWLCLMGPAIFKVGIASDPCHRFFSCDIGYVLEERWHFMDVFWQGPANECRQVEIDIISATRCVEGSCNEKPGGDGVHPDRTHQCYVYLVLACAGHGISLKKARKLRSGAMD